MSAFSAPARAHLVLSGHASVGSRWHDLGVRAANYGVRNFAPDAPPASGDVDVIDLFCGCGGLSLGFEIVGRMTGRYRIAEAVDIDHWSTRTYAANTGTLPRTADLYETAATPRSARAFVDSLDLRPGATRVLIGGPPCQGFSAHRKKDGSHRGDGRNQLGGAFARIAAQLRADVVVMENVPELLARRHWHLFAAVRDELEAAGYNVRAQIHNLAGYGVPQSRFRALIVAARRPFAMPRAFLSPSQFRTVRDAIGLLRPVEAGHPDPLDPLHRSASHRTSTLETIRRVPHNGGSRPTGVGPACLDRVDGFRDVYGRMAWDLPANTITAFARNPASGRYVHPDQDRGITIREAALLQSFPPSARFEGPFDNVFSQIGNAVPPSFSAYLAAHVLGILASDMDPRDEDDRADVLSPRSDSFSSGIAGLKKGARG